MGEQLRRAWRYGSDLAAEVDGFVERSAVGRRFKLAERGSTLTREVRAGATTFLTMAYIMAANASILADSGGTCTANDCTGPHRLDPTCKYFPVDAGYAACIERSRRSLIVATAASAALGSSLMGALANLPVALAPGMGLNAYFAYTLVGFHGSGLLPYGAALAAVFLEGALFLVAAGTGVGPRLARLLVPAPLRLAVPAGIGLFLALLGLQTGGAAGVGLVGFGPSTLLSLAACPASSLVRVAPVSLLPNATLALAPPSASASASAAVLCAGRRLQSPTFWLAAAGFLAIAHALMRRAPAGVAYGVLLVTLASWLRSTPFTAFPDTPAGDAAFRYFAGVADLRAAARAMRAAGAIRFSHLGSAHFWGAVLTFLYVDVLETAGTICALAKQAGLVAEDEGGGGDLERQYAAAFVSNAAAIMAGAALGMSTVTVYGESSAGIREGGRTGLTALVVAACFALAMPFAPLLAAIPPWAVGPPLVIVGVLLMEPAMGIAWADMGQAAPAFITIILMPLTYSIAYGLMAGIAVYVALHAPQHIIGALMSRCCCSRVAREVPIPDNDAPRSESGSGSGSGPGLGPEPEPKPADIQIVVKHDTRLSSDRPAASTMNPNP